MLSPHPNSLLRLPVGLGHYAHFEQPSLDDQTTFLIVQFVRPGAWLPDQYYVAILPIDAPVNPKDVQAVFAAALVWDTACNQVELAHKIAVWLGEQL